MAVVHVLWVKVVQNCQQGVSCYATSSSSVWATTHTATREARGWHGPFPYSSTRYFYVTQSLHSILDAGFRPINQKARVKLATKVCEDPSPGPPKPSYWKRTARERE